MARDTYAVTEEVERGLPWEPIRTRVISVHSSLQDANTAAEEVAEEKVHFSWFPRGIKRQQSTSEHGGLRIDLKMDPMEEFSSRNLVTVVKREADPVTNTANTGNLLKKTEKGFKIMIPYGKPGGLQRGDRIAKITFCGEFDSMSRREAQHAVDVYGGKVVNTFPWADYAVVGKAAFKSELRWLRKGKAEFLNEKGFYELLKTGVPKDKYLKDIQFDALGHFAGGTDAEEDNAGDSNIEEHSDIEPDSHLLGRDSDSSQGNAPAARPAKRRRKQ